MHMHESSDALIDLGAASIETQGAAPFQIDSEGVGLPMGMQSDD